MTYMHTDRGVIQVAVLVGIAALLTTGAILAGAMMTPSEDDSQPDPETVLADVEETYTDADTILLDATITTDHEVVDQHAFTMSVASAEENQTRVELDSGNGGVVAGSTDDARWIELPEIGIAAVAENGSVSVSPQAALFETALEENPSDLSSITEIGPAAEGLTELDDDLDIPTNITDPPFSTGSWNQSWNHSTEDVITVDYVETTTVEETETHLISVTPDGNETSGELRLWVSTDEDQLVKHQLQTDRGNITTTITEQRLNSNIEDSTFEPPQTDFFEDIQTVDTRDELDTTVDGDTAVLNNPPFEFETGTVTDITGMSVVVSEYTGPVEVTLVQTDHLATIPIDGQQRTIDNQSVTVGQVEGEPIAIWEQDGVTLGAVGPETTEELEAVVTATELV